MKFVTKDVAATAGIVDPDTGYGIPSIVYVITEAGRAFALPLEVFFVLFDPSDEDAKVVMRGINRRIEERKPKLESLEDMEMTMQMPDSDPVKMTIKHKGSK